MLFKDFKPGYPIYILDRKAVTVTTGKVTNAPITHFDNRFAGAGKMIVDLNVEANGSTTTYVFDDTASIGYAENLVLAANREDIIREVESLKAQSEEAIRMASWHHEALDKCDKLLQDLSPEYKQRTDYAERISGLEKKMDKLGDAITNIIKKLEEGGAR